MIFCTFFQNYSLKTKDLFSISRKGLQRDNLEISKRFLLKNIVGRLWQKINKFVYFTVNKIKIDLVKFKDRSIISGYLYIIINK